MTNEDKEFTARILTQVFKLSEAEVNYVLQSVEDAAKARDMYIDSLAKAACTTGTDMHRAHINIDSISADAAAHLEAALSFAVDGLGISQSEFLSEVIRLGASSYVERLYSTRPDLVIMQSLGNHPLTRVWPPYSELVKFIHGDALPASGENTEGEESGQES